MGHYLLSAEATFSAAHTLPGVDKCENLHGHDWRVRITVRVEEDGLDRNGMGTDFRVIEQAARSAVADLDHRYLNDLPEFRGVAPTAEFLARLLAERSAAALADVTPPPTASLDTVEVWEMPEYRVVYRP
jgi:6-pyruvoyltetrahydropterin/6-carboxytetrahydropterin synthase